MSRASASSLLPHFLYEGDDFFIFFNCSKLQSFITVTPGGITGQRALQTPRLESAATGGVWRGSNAEAASPALGLGNFYIGAIIRLFREMKGNENDIGQLKLI